MAWNDAPPTKDELKATAPTGWADAPPTKDELAKVAGSIDNPGTTDLYGSDLDRVKAGFGDPKGLADLLAKRGYSDVQKNSAGDLIAKGTAGKYFRDDNRFFSGHPLNWAESGMGKSLPLAGTVGGAIMGNVPGAAIGGATGEAARQSAGRLMGVNDQDAGDAALEIGKEGAMGGVAEVGGKYIAAPVLKYLTQKFGPLVKSGVASTSSLISGVPKEAVERLIERPSEVMSANAPGNALKVGLGARQELLDRSADESAAIKQARAQFADQFGDAKVNTQPILAKQSGFLEGVAPNADGRGAMSSDEMARATAFQNDLTHQVRMSPLKDIGIEYGPPETQAVALTPPKSVSTDYGDIPATVLKAPRPTPARIAQMSAAGKDAAEQNLGNANSTGYSPYEKPPTVDVSTVRPTLSFGKSPETLAVYPEKSAGDLQKFADYLKTQVTQFDQSKLPGSSDTPSQANMRRLYGQVKGSLHGLDPEGLGAADKRYSDFANLSDMFGRLEDPSKAESVISNFYGKNKTMQQEAAEELLPNSMESIKDIAADKSFNMMGPAGSPHGRRAIGGMVGGLGLMGHGYASHSPGQMALGGALALGSSGPVHRAMIGGGSQLIDAVSANPALLKTVTNPALREKLSQMLTDSRAGVPAIAGSGAASRDTASEDKAAALYGSGAQDVGQESAKSAYIQGN